VPDPVRTSLLDYLPAVFRQEAAADAGFLGRFLEGFAGAFDQLQQEVDAIPELFAVVPTPALAAAAAAGSDVLRLDSAVGLCGGDVLHVREENAGRAEVVELLAVTGGLDPTGAVLTEALRFDHAAGTSLAVLQPAPPGSELAAPAAVGQATLHLVDPGALRAVAGDVLRVDDGERLEHAQVRTVDHPRATVTLRRALRRPHDAGRPVRCMEPAPTATPPPAFADAVRDGPELVLRAPVLAGEAGLEVDTTTGLRVGDVLHLRELDPARVEFARVDALPAEQAVPGVLRGAVRLAGPLRFAHDAGAGMAVLGGVGPGTVLAVGAQPGAAAIEVDDPDAPGVTTGRVVRLGADEHAQVVGVQGRVVAVVPPPLRAHPRGEPVVPLLPSAAGTAFLRWLAGLIGLALRPDRGERWNRELLRLAGRLWPLRGTRAGLQAHLRAVLRGDADAVVFDPANPLQVGLVATVGVDTIVCGGLPYFFWVELATEQRNSRLYSPLGLSEMVQAAQAVLRAERPAHTYYQLRLRAHTMQLGVDPGTEVGARVGDTTLLWNQAMSLPGDR
jgi:hypothetical protein